MLLITVVLDNILKTVYVMILTHFVKFTKELVEHAKVVFLDTDLTLIKTAL